MKIATMVVFKDEADILPAYLKRMEDHVDYFLWRDNGSTDGGGDIVKNHPKTVFFDTIEGTYTMSMKDRLWEEVQKYLSEDDWVCGGAPDLFPMFDIRKEIANADAAGYHSIYTHFPTFFFTQEMHQRYKTDSEYRAQIDSFDQKNYQYYYNMSKHTAAIIKNVKKNGNRVRYTQPRQEPPLIPGGPKGLRSSLCFAHYRFRSPAQMKSRMERNAKVNPQHKKHVSFAHYTTWDWKDYLVPEEKLFRIAKNKPMNLNRKTFYQLLRKK